MTNDAFRELVARLEPLAAANPTTYKLRVGALALLGYGYIAGVLVLLLALSALVVLVAVTGKSVLILKLLVVFLVVIGAILRALWVKMPVPGGIQIESPRAPAFFEALHAIRKELRTPRLHQVLLTDDFNAAIVQVPRLGMLGWHRNYLLVGLPLLQAVTPDEWRAVLAHEMGHLSGNHGRFAAWIFRQRRTWGQLLQTLEDSGNELGILLFGGFFRWFAPFFNAYSFVLARAHEFEADRAAAEVAGSGNVRSALMRIEACGRLLRDRFWPGISSESVDSREPPRDPYQRLRAALRTGPHPDELAAWVGEALARPTDLEDTHPALADRLRSLGWQAPGEGVPTELPTALEGPSAAEAFLGELEAPLELSFEQNWVAGVQHQWRQRHDALQKAKARLADLEIKADDELSVEERWDRVAINRTLGHEEQALEAAIRLAQDQPDHAGARFHVGQALLAKGDRGGIEHLEAAMAENPIAILPACGELFEFHWARGEQEAAERYRSMANARTTEAEAARRERARVDRSARFESHDLPEELVEDLRQHLARHNRLGRAYIVRRKVQYVPEEPCYVVGIVPREAWWKPRRTKAARKAFHEAVQDLRGLPDETYFFLLVDELKWLRRKLRKVPGSEQ